jgi:hypothetical protein
MGNRYVYDKNGKLIRIISDRGPYDGLAKLIGMIIMAVVIMAIIRSC